jgi:hypothetical protein
MVVRAGRSKLDQRFVVLHELAHVLREHRARGNPIHDIRFWRIAFDLYEQHGFEMYAVEREWGYRAGARQVIRERGLVEPVAESGRT